MADPDPVRPPNAEAAQPAGTTLVVKELSGVGKFFAQYVGPTAAATIIASLISVYTAVGAAQEKQREYNTKFQELVTSPDIKTAFGGQFVDDAAKTGKLDRTKESFEQGVREQKATAALLSLQSVADSETQRRTVLLIGARLLNADSSYVGTGGPAARLLTVLIDEVDSGRESWNPMERHRNERLWDTINAQSFRDLVTAGYSSDYYNDDFSNVPLRTYSPTLNGDAPITADPKFQILHKLTPDRYEGWVHLATFGYKFPRGVKARTAPGSSRGSAQPVLTPQLASDFLKEMVDVTLDRHVGNVDRVTAQYAIADPREVPPVDPRFIAGKLVSPDTYPKQLIMLRHRLLRNRPPVQYINPDGKFRKGSLGKILGAVPAGACITVQEPLLPVLVFVPTDVVSPPAAKPSSQAPAAPAADGSQSLSGLVHMWAHVKGSSAAENCLLTVNAPAG